MNAKTKQDYRKLAAHFRKRWMKDEALTAEGIICGLTTAAPSYRPGYFRRLKNALAFALEEKQDFSGARRVKALRNPVTVPGSCLPKKPKQPRLKSISNEDTVALLEFLLDAGFQDEHAAVTLISFLGVRPSELRGIIASDGYVYVPGSKVTEDGKRGADRTLRVTHKGLFQLIQHCVQILSESNRSIGAIRDRLRQEVKRLWPRRKRWPSLYTFRHQFGADLKRSGEDRRTAAYVMGHQSTLSLNAYGNRRQGNLGMIYVEPADSASLEKVRGRMHPEKWKKFAQGSASPLPY